MYSASVDEIDEESHPKSESREKEEKSWITGGEKKTESGLHASAATSNEEEEDEDEDDNYITWQSGSKNRNWLWQRWILPRSGARGFSIFGIIESAFSTVTKFIGSIMSNEDGEEELDYQNNGVTYKDHQLLRLTPKNVRQVRHLLKLKKNEPDNVKFWTVPAKDKYVRIDCNYAT
jgi:hypothetical protein